ncbi:MAG: NADP-dependent phosphogluconate dehydrogenase [Pseudomonadota bacterium]
MANIGLIGLGTMGSALALNIADNGFDIAVHNRTTARIGEFVTEAGPLGDKIIPAESLEAFIDALASPRLIILMVPAGPVVDKQIAALELLLAQGDVVVDAGNANYIDTNRRYAEAEGKPFEFFGLGVSGGEEGARFGPSMMGGGSRAAWDKLSDVLLAISAKHTDDTPCAARLGDAGAGHFVKMVHNGIEYADMQMIAEIFGILRDGHGWSADRCGELFEQWNKGPLRSYLVEITAEICKAKDTKTGKPILDVILDKAGQKGTGRWTAIEAQHLGVPVAVIEAAVSARNMSARLDIRNEGEKRFGALTAMDDEADLDALHGAMLAGKVICYAQGFEMLAEASDEFGWSLDLAEVARVWRAGCIIRSDMLDDMASAFEGGASNLAFADDFATAIAENHAHLRAVVAKAIAHGVPVPCLSAGIGWLDQLRQARSTANLIQGQRDFFGRHGFARRDVEGDDHHGPWAD